MNTFYLIRHGANDWIPRGLAGRAAGVHLNEEGRNQAQALAVVLKTAGIDVVVSSPLERTLETATPLAHALSASIRQDDGLIEVDFGDWSGKEWVELCDDEKWKSFSVLRSCKRVPGGELMVEVQHRVVLLIDRLTQEFPGKTIALVSHGDVIRSALAYFLGMPIDLFHRLEISPGSYSVVRMLKEMPHVICINRLP